MNKAFSWLSMLFLGSIILGFFGCTKNEEAQLVEVLEDTPPPTPPSVLDLSEAIGKRIEGKPSEAIEILRKLNEEFPRSSEVLVQLGRSLADAGEFALAAFRFEQAVSLGASHEIVRESAEAHAKSGDLDASIERYTLYFSKPMDDPKASLAFARLLAQKGRNTDALNTFTQASRHALAQDCLIMGSLFTEKKLFPQAKHWFREASRRSNSPGVESAPLLGLLQVAFLEKNDAEAETLVLALEKSNPGTLDSSPYAQVSADLIRERRLADFIARGVDARGKKVSELASALFAGLIPPSDHSTQVVSSGPKLPSDLPVSDIFQEEKTVQSEERIEEPKPRGFSLADAFAAPLEDIATPQGATESKLEQGRKEFLNGNYTSALLLARDALKDDSTDAEAWRLCSQSHFQLGEIDEAEMTILEAIRHQPVNFEMRMDYLRIARETLPSKRYLIELEKVRDIFPESTEILWELARRYEIVEKMPVTAAVLYRKIIELSPPQSAIAQQAQMELSKFQSP